MKNEFTAVFEWDGDWVIGYCPEVPGANGQGRTLDECRESLREAVVMIRLIDRRLADHAASPAAAVPWEQVEATALARLGE